jgi:hypothetical protein
MTISPMDSGGSLLNRLAEPRRRSRVRTTPVGSLSWITVRLLRHHRANKKAHMNSASVEFRRACVLGIILVGTSILLPARAESQAGGRRTTISQDSAANLAIRRLFLVGCVLTNAGDTVAYTQDQTDRPAELGKLYWRIEGFRRSVPRRVSTSLWKVEVTGRRYFEGKVESSGHRVKWSQGVLWNRQMVWDVYIRRGPEGWAPVPLVQDQSRFDRSRRAPSNVSAPTCNDVRRLEGLS